MSSGRSLYLNGNYIVRSVGLDIQKRCLRVDEDFRAEFPDSIDLKITDKCSWGCPYCHESSTKNGESFDFEKTKEILSQLPELPIEIAIGGGDVLDAPKFKELVSWLNNRGNRTRATVNMKDILNRRKQFENYMRCVEAIGVSIDRLPEFIKDWENKDSMLSTISGNINKIGPFGSDKYYVIHIIAGVFPYKDLEKLFDSCESPILILGYKQWGRALGTELPKDLQKFKEVIQKIVVEKKNEEYHRFSTRKTIGFDNLALDQLDIKSILPEEEWKKIYLGDEGTHSMYIDAVKGEFAMTSRSEDRVSWDSIGLIDYFKGLRHD